MITRTMIIFGGFYAKKLRKEPHERLMVGNDVQEDLVAGHIGMKTLFIEDNIIHREDMEVKAGYRGTYIDLLNFAKSLANLKKESSMII